MQGRVGEKGRGGVGSGRVTVSSPPSQRQSPVPLPAHPRHGEGGVFVENVGQVVGTFLLLLWGSPPHTHMVTEQECPNVKCQSSKSFLSKIEI